MGRMSSRIPTSLLHTIPRSLFSSSISSNNLSFRTLSTLPSSPQNPFSSSSFSPPISHFVGFPFKPASSFSSSPTLRFLNTNSSDHIDSKEDHPHQYETSEGETTDGWEEEEEEEVEPEIGDGGDGGGIVLQNVPWGERVLSIAREVLLQFGGDMELFSFKTTPRGYIYVRLDKLSNKYGCPSMEEIERYNLEYKKKLDEMGALGEIPHNLAIEVSSPGAERLLKVPDDLDRFKDMPMRVSYVEDVETQCLEKDGVFMLESIKKESANCVWKLANVRENRDPLGKGRPLSRKQKDWRLNLPFEMFRRVTLYLEY
ncbi:hypothetical protein AAG906_002040 [Vitis piasezkii]